MPKFINTLNISEVFSAHKVEYAIICSGSRSAPLTLSFVRNTKIKPIFIFDERSAAFIALGIAQRLNKPVVLICTSGTAAQNFAPAVTEAFYQQIPLLVLTADRPKEWIGQRDGQAIKQEQIFEPNIIKSYSIQIADNHDDNNWYLNRILNEAILKSTSSESGPVHINFGFREPFYPEKNKVGNSENVQIIKRFDTHKSINKNIWDDFVSLLIQYPKKLIVVGQMLPNNEFNTALNSFVNDNKLPIIADINSNFQFIDNAINYSDLIVSSENENQLSGLKPDLLITFGRELVSKNLKKFLRNYKPACHIHVQERDEIIDTFQTITHLAPVSPESFVNELVNRVNIASSKKYLELWKQKNSEQKLLLEEFIEQNKNSELGILHSIIQYIPEDSVLHTANSLSVRYLNLISSPTTLNYCNRGTSGIDGCTSTAIGSAIVSDEIVTLITGDVAFFYDSNAFWNDFVPKNLRIIIINNNGGAIFRSVEGAKQQPELETYFVGKNKRTAQLIAKEFDIDYHNYSNQIPDNEVLLAFFSKSKKAKIMEIQTENIQNQDFFVKLREYVGKHYPFTNSIATN